MDIDEVEVTNGTLEEKIQRLIELIEELEIEKEQVAKTTQGCSAGSVKQCGEHETSSFLKSLYMQLDLKLQCDELQQKFENESKNLEVCYYDLLTEKDAEISKLKEDLRHSQIEVVDLERTVDDMQEKVDDLEDKIECLEAKVEDLEEANEEGMPYPYSSRMRQHIQLPYHHDYQGDLQTQMQYPYALQHPQVQPHPHALGCLQSGHMDATGPCMLPAPQPNEEPVVATHATADFGADNAGSVMHDADDSTDFIADNDAVEAGNIANDADDTGSQM